MNYPTTLVGILQSVFPHEEIQAMLEHLGYVDTARKFSVYDLFLFLAEAALQQWDGYRDGEQRMAAAGLQPAHYSTISKKAKAVPFAIFKQLLHLLIGRCNRATRRRLSIPKPLLAVDSTMVITGRSRLPWAPYSSIKAGIKLHVGYLTQEGDIHRVAETTAKQHDLPICPEVTDARFILLADRAYGKYAQFDAFTEQKSKQYFVIRLKDNTHLHAPVSRKRKQRFKGTIKRDVTCRLGTKTVLTRNAFRVVELTDPDGHPVMLATNLHKPSAERIAEMYRQRWQIEVFFRWIKQHLNVSHLFGTTPNAVFGQMYTALIVYVLLHKLYVQGNSTVHACAQITFATFHRLLGLVALPMEWQVYLAHSFTLQDPEYG